MQKYSTNLEKAFNCEAELAAAEKMECQIFQS